jgi:hypothetical protein
MKLAAGLLVLLLGAAPAPAAAAEPNAPPISVESPYIGPSYVGPSGYYFTPDGATLPKGRMSLYFRRLENLNLHGRSGSFWNANIYGVNYGVMKRLEVGLAAVQQKTISDDIDFVGSVKFIALPEKPDAVGVVLGITDVADQLPDGFSPYLYLTKDLSHYYGVRPDRPGALAVGAGYGSGIYDNFFLNLRLRAIRGVDVLVEYGEMSEFVFGRDRDHMVSFGLRGWLGNGVSLDLSWLGETDALSFGVSWTGRLPH